MEPEQQQLIFKLAFVPGRSSPIERDEFLRLWGASDGRALGLELLRDAVERRDGEDVEWSMIVSFVFGFTNDHLPLLIDLAYADWHQDHQDVASALGTLAAPSSVVALLHLGQWVPEYLEFDETRALARHVLRSLNAIATDEATRALEVMTRSSNAVVAREASEFVAERRGES